MDKTRKKKWKQYIAWVCLVVLVALLAAMPLIAGNSVEAEGPVATVKSGAVDRGTIGVTLGGGGNLAEESPEAITLPEGILLKEFLVKNGDPVREGDPLAAVDPISVMAALADIQETMDYLAKQIEAAGDDEGATRLKAQTAGRVKEIYAQAGDDVQDVMLEHGALAVLSLDGRMAVDVECAADLSAGDSVTVLLADDREITGRVESCLGGMLKVTVPDGGYAIGEKALVMTADGEELGSGELYVHNAWHVTAYFGKVAKVNVKENDKVTAGKLLITLEETGHSTQAQVLNVERQEYEELMEKLFTIYQNGYLTAPCDGYVYGVDSESTWLLAAAEAAWKAEMLVNSASGEKSWTVMLLSDVTPEDGEAPPAGGETPPGGDETPPEGEVPVKTYHVISAVRVDAAVSEGIWSVRRKDINATVTDLSVLSISIPDTAPAEELAIGSVQTLLGQPHAVQAGDILLYVEEGGGTYWLYLTNAGGFGGMGGFGGLGGLFRGGSTQTTVFEKYDLTQTTVLTVTPGETMTVDITVDEMDIRHVYPGQEVTVTIHALSGETVPGTVTRIGAASNAGGNSKFAVTVELDRGQRMLSGMSASVSIPLGSVENVLRIPVAALNGTGNKVFVYTGYNEKEDILTAPVQVTLGISDGEYVQILSGLEEGDAYWYSYYDAREDSGI